MARASTKTFLPLDIWAKQFGYNLWLFNGFSQLPSTIGSQCHDVWYQYPEQFDTLSREELAQSIAHAEREIISYLGYNVLPDWDVELLIPPSYHKPGYTSNLTTKNRGKSVRVSKNYVRDLGIKVKHLLETVPISQIDKDNDGFIETGRITLSYPTISKNEIRLYAPGKSGDDTWEIRPYTVVNSTTIEFPLYLVPQFDLLENMVSVNPLDPTNPAMFLTELDVYRVYNDDQTNVVLIYNSCTGCDEIAVSTCGRIEDEKYGYIVYNPTFICSPTGATEPDKIQLSYYSGWVGKVDQPLHQIDNIWWQPIAYLAIGYFDKPVRNCCGGTQSQLVTKWADDYTVGGKDVSRRVYATSSMLEHPFGVTTRGAYFAWQRIKHLTML